MLLGRSRSCRIIRVSLRYCHRLSPSSSSSTSSSTHTVHSISINCNVHLYCFFFSFFPYSNNRIIFFPKFLLPKRKKKRGTNTRKSKRATSISELRSNNLHKLRTLIYTLKQLIEVCTQYNTISRNNSEKHSLTHIEKRRELNFSQLHNFIRLARKKLQRRDKGKKKKEKCEENVANESKNLTARFLT